MVTVITNTKKIRVKKKELKHHIPEDKYKASRAFSISKESTKKLELALKHSENKTGHRFWKFIAFLYASY